MSATSDLLGSYQHIIDRVVLITGDKGVFDVVVDGEPLYSKKVEGRHARPGEVLARFTERYAAGVRAYRT